MTTVFEGTPKFGGIGDHARVMCDRCNGSGYVWTVGNCPTCGGDGWIAVSQPSAPDAVARLRTENDRLRAALTVIAEWAETADGHEAIMGRARTASIALPN